LDGIGYIRITADMLRFNSIYSYNQLGTSGKVARDCHEKYFIGGEGEGMKMVLRIYLRDGGYRYF
jgi:hypothetical protein